MANNVQMPRFARASGMSSSENWNEVDNFDVDLLAECLLDDGNIYGQGITFDFNLDTNIPDSTLVSPENSEDGNAPPVADMNQQQMHFAPTPLSTMLQQTAQAPAPQVMSSMQQLVPAPAPQQALLVPAPAPQHNQMNMQPQQMQSMNMMSVLGGSLQMQQQPQLQQQQPAAQISQGLIYHNHSGMPDPKRQRTDATPAPAPGLMQIQSFAQGPGMMTGQQLAAAAAQALQQGRGRKKSQAQIDRRRERNRILARRTRLRKKFFFESLQKEVMDLQKENQRLKNIVKEEINTEEGQRLLDECDAAEKMPSAVLEACGGNENSMDSHDYNLVQSIRNSQHSFIITDPSLSDNPIVFASDAFLELTGYSKEQVLGRNCRFLQGTDTCRDSIEKIRKGLSNGEDVSVTLLNYKADGTPFWNRLFIAALRDAQNNIVNFIGVTVMVPGPDEDHYDDEAAETTEFKDIANDDADETDIKAIEDSVSAAVAATSG